MPAVSPEVAFSIGLLGVLAGVCGFIYGRALFTLARHGGRVHVAAFGVPEALFAALLASWFGLLIYGSLDGPPAKTTERSMVQGTFVFVMIVLLLLCFLKTRGHPLRELFGFSRLGPIALVPKALGYLLAAFPLVAALNLVVQQFFSTGDRGQEIVRFFLEANQRGDTRAIALTIGLGVVVAPLCEELIFRGFIYGTAKRYLGIGPALLLSSLLFAVVHLSLPALPGLMLLAVCFALAYEATGSLLTSMLMHAGFNATSFALMMLFPHLPT